ncbi:general secretion pathway protein G [Bacillus ectoiniformans]|uniref:prepilin-type N-terminal cleavage/methylation domain-containing protein n=1 Tax=Bacillus ectoiniformans TaxID=1494429 RepID=UPI00195AA24F|nr:prepilin-type N-terminal cleavage/methylation domain-containing protein [Bacillus ectoiniformans]MBM7648944.1 general secretion pathway protein G [Bacillus ectoiniformans]
MRIRGGLNDKGYTLVELLAVVVILAIIAAIAVIGIGGIIERSKEQAFVANAVTLKSAARYYVKDRVAHEEEVPEKIDYSMLHDAGLIEVIQDPFTKSDITPSLQSYAIASGERIQAICLIGNSKKLCSYQTESGKVEGPVPIAELKEENITDK